MDPISSSTASWSVPTPSVPTVPTASAAAERPSVGPYYGARIINDAVETTIAAIQSLADLGIGAKFDSLA